jgi:phosphoribosyl-dephospho-CoA transferase
MRSTDTRRHDRVWLAAATWRSHLIGDLDDRRIAWLDDWTTRGRALVTRRREPSATADVCFLAVALPSSAGRTRISLAVNRKAVTRVAAPLRLDEVIDQAPNERRIALAALHERSAALDTSLHVYGSYAWQMITGEPCVTPDSDLDLLWDARDAAHVERMLALLSAWEIEYDLRADGEARFADGASVAWRELYARTSHVLVKRDDAVALERSPLSATTSRNDDRAAA